MANNRYLVQGKEWNDFLQGKCTNKLYVMLADYFVDAICKSASTGEPIIKCAENVKMQEMLGINETQQFLFVSLYTTIDMLNMYCYELLLECVRSDIKKENVDKLIKKLPNLSSEEKSRYQSYYETYAKIKNQFISILGENNINDFTVFKIIRNCLCHNDELSEESSFTSDFSNHTKEFNFIYNDNKYSIILNNSDLSILNKLLSILVDEDMGYMVCKLEQGKITSNNVGYIYRNKTIDNIDRYQRMFINQYLKNHTLNPYSLTKCFPSKENAMYLENQVYLCISLLEMLVDNMLNSKGDLSFYDLYKRYYKGNNDYSVFCHTIFNVLRIASLRQILTNSNNYYNAEKVAKLLKMDKDEVFPYINKLRNALVHGRYFCINANHYEYYFYDYLLKDSKFKGNDMKPKLMEIYQKLIEEGKAKNKVNSLEFIGKLSVNNIYDLTRVLLGQDEINGIKKSKMGKIASKSKLIDEK